MALILDIAQPAILNSHCPTVSLSFPIYNEWVRLDNL